MILRTVRADELNIGDWFIDVRGDAIKINDIEQVRPSRIRLGFSEDRYRYVSPSELVQVLDGWATRDAQFGG